MTAARKAGGNGNWVQSLEKRLLYAVDAFNYEPVTNLAVTAISSSAIKVSWTDNSFDEGNYLVMRSTRALNTAADVVSRSADVTFFTLAANTTSFVDVGLQPSTDYFYNVVTDNYTGLLDPNHLPPAIATEQRTDHQFAERVLDAHRHRFDYFIIGSEVDTSTLQSNFAVLDGTGTLNIRGSTGDDIFGIEVTGPLLIVKFNGAAASFTASTVNRININAYAGDDRISVIPGVIGCNINGGDGDDTIFGADGADRIDGGAGDDLIKGQGGNDTIFGSAGNDSIYGQAGNDSIQGNDGDDRILGGDGDDYINGGAGNDRLYGENGFDTLLGGSGHNTILQDPLP